MDGTARRAIWQAKVVGLLTALAAACATVQQPPGGPFDASPPVLLHVIPDSGTVATDFDDDVEFQFDEVIDERSGGNLANLINVSPRHDDVRVSWKRNRVTVKPGGGWLPGETYTVSLQPGIADLRQNRYDSSRTIVFSTGTSIPATQVAGNVVDWEAGIVATGALVELIRVGDSVTYVGITDSIGTFSIRGAPSGQYLVIATLDENNNERRERREAFDSALVSLDSVATFDLWTFSHDSTGPTMRNAGIVDSMAVATEFTQALASDIQVAHSARVFLLPDSVPIDVASILWQPDFDSLRAAQLDSLAVVADSIAAAQRDSIAAAIRDSIGTDSLAVDPLVPDSVIADSTVADTISFEETVVDADSTSLEDAEEIARQDALLSQRPPIYNTFVIVLLTALVPGEQYVIEASVTNLLGHAETSTRTLLIPLPVDSITPPDST